MGLYDVGRQGSGATHRSDSYATVLIWTRIPARAARVMSISRLSFSPLPRTGSAIDLLLLPEAKQDENGTADERG